MSQAVEVCLIAFNSSIDILTLKKIQIKIRQSFRSPVLMDKQAVCDIFSPIIRVPILLPINPNFE